MTKYFPNRSDGNSRPDTVESRSALIEDVAIQAALQPWVEIDYVQLSGGRKVAQLDSLDLGGQQIVRETQATSVQKLGLTPADFCTVSICTQGPTTRFSEHCGEAGDTIFFMPENVEFDIHIPAGGETAYIGFSQEEFLRGARALNPGFWERPPTSVIPLISHRRREFKEAVDLLLKAGRAAAARGAPLNREVLRTHLLHTVLDIVTTTQNGPGPSYSERMRAFQIGRDARRFVDDRLDADALPTVVDICEELGISERTLRYAFQEYVGLSPVAYLRMCRLNRVRTALAAADPTRTTITQVAMRHGFLHLGRFAGDYRRMFGETPSATLGF